MLPRYALVVTAPALDDFRVFLATAAVWHTDATPAAALFLLCDSTVAAALRDGAAAAYPGPIRARVELDAWSATPRAAMEAQPGDPARGLKTRFHDFTALKAVALRWALTAEDGGTDGGGGGAWLVDADLLWLSGPLPRRPRQVDGPHGEAIAGLPLVALSAHDMSAQDEAAYGVYNAGLLWCADTKVVDWWEAALPSSRFFEQAALEDVATAAIAAAGGDRRALMVLPPTDNYGVWRVFRPLQGASPLDALSGWGFAPIPGTAGLTVLGVPVRAVHTHVRHHDPFNTVLLEALEAFASADAGRWAPAGAVIAALTAVGSSSGVGAPWRALGPRRLPLGTIGGGAPLYPPFMVPGGDVEAAVGAELRRRHPTGVVHGSLFLPAQWTAAQLRPRFKTDEAPALQAWLDVQARHITRTGGEVRPAFFTVVQHDDGVFGVRLPPHTLVFSAGGTGHVALPLWYDDGGALRALRGGARGFNDRPLLVSFVGALTHMCRRAMVSALTSVPRTDVLILASPTWSPAPTVVAQRTFVDATLRAKFGLAPRGYGRTSFRLLEVAMLGAVPVYVYDDPGPWLPFQDVLDWTRLAVLVHVRDLASLEARLRSITQEAWEGMRSAWISAAHHFTAAGMVDAIERELGRRAVAAAAQTPVRA